MNRSILISIIALLAFFSCKKHPTEKTSCTSTWYGYTIPDSTIHDSVGLCSFGIINSSSLSLSTLATFTGSGHTNQVAYNTSDHCYYGFYTPMDHIGSFPWLSSAPLYKIDPSGTISYFTNSISAAYSSIIYNAATNKLYCVSNGNLSEITTTASTFSTTSIATTTHPFTGLNFNYITIDNATGNMYCITGDTVSGSFIEKYAPGITSTTVVTPINFNHIYGLQFNKNDSQLYVLVDAWTHNSFIKIDPTTGTTSVIATYASSPNFIFCSAAIDPCSNRYIFSSHSSNSIVDSNYIDQVSMTVTLLHHTLTSVLYQGLQIVE